MKQLGNNILGTSNIRTRDIRLNNILEEMFVLMSSEIIIDFYNNMMYNFRISQFNF